MTPRPKAARLAASAWACVLLAVAACAPAPRNVLPPSEDTVARMTTLFRDACLANAGNFARTEKALLDYGFDASSGLGGLVSFVDTGNYLIATVGDAQQAPASGTAQRARGAEIYCSVSSPNVSERQARDALQQAVSGFIAEARLVQGDAEMRAAGAAWLMIPTAPATRAKDSLLAVTIEDLPLPDFYQRANGRPDQRVPVFRSYGLAIVRYR